MPKWRSVFRCCDAVKPQLREQRKQNLLDQLVLAARIEVRLQLVAALLLSGRLFTFLLAFGIAIQMWPRRVGVDGVAQSIA
jgi:hypothetical protein